ncbi:hypothetical protein Pcinc_038519 [Petrolisthes cinctipes]|uniref:Uncharacterized protein n=1 Tax=Petrolisthes cinctipes TaxID=88211 RepID=A0AAE1BU86_PETCI|nr:hypothetical protein Pcinc_038519 [Petrolisthes cinctipes]
MWLENRKSKACKKVIYLHMKPIQRRNFKTNIVMRNTANFSSHDSRSTLGESNSGRIMQAKAIQPYLKPSGDLLQGGPRSQAN